MPTNRSQTNARIDNRLLTEGLWRLLAKYSLPSVTSMVGISLYILADTYFIANGIGELALAALNIAMPAYALIGCIGNMVGIGGATVFAIARELNDRRAHRDVFTLCIAAAIGSAAIFSLCGLFFAGDIAALLGASAGTRPYATVYIRVLLLFAPVFVVNNVLLAFIRNDGAPNLAMISMLSAVLFNIVFDYLFIYIFGWGMFGAVFATCLSPVIGIAILARHFALRRNTFRLRRIRPSAAMMLRVFKGGAATFVTELATGLVILGFNFKLLKLLGDLGVAAYGVISNISYVAVAIFTGFGQGIQPIASSNYGAGRYDRCKRLLRNAYVAAFVLSLVLLVAIALHPAQIAGLFNKDANPDLTRIAAHGIVRYFPFLLFCGVNFVAIAYYQAIMESRTAIAASLTRGFFGVILGLAVLPNLLGASGIWLTAPFAELLGTLLVAHATVRDLRRPAPTGE